MHSPVWVAVSTGRSQVWMISFVNYDPGYFDKEWGRVEPGPAPFELDEVLTMCPV